MRRNEYIKGSKKPKYKAEFPWRRARAWYGFRCEIPIYKRINWVFVLKRSGSRKNQKWKIELNILKDSMAIHVATGKSQTTLRNAIKEAERLYKNMKKRF